MLKHLLKHCQSCVFLAAWCVLGICGCGPDLPETIPVTGRVLYDGEPVANAQIGFVPQTEDSGALPARGQTDATGQFALKTYFGPDQDVEGAAPGEYLVTVEKRDIPADPDELTRMFAQNPGMVPKNLLPERYARATESPLKASVKSGADNSFEFKLEAASKPQ